MGHLQSLVDGGDMSHVQKLTEMSCSFAELQTWRFCNGHVGSLLVEGLDAVLYILKCLLVTVYSDVFCNLRSCKK